MVGVLDLSHKSIGEEVAKMFVIKYAGGFERYFANEFFSDLESAKARLAVIHTAVKPEFHQDIQLFELSAVTQ